jgi:hypothetical protein
MDDKVPKNSLALPLVALVFGAILNTMNAKGCFAAWDPLIGSTLVLVLLASDEQIP